MGKRRVFLGFSIITPTNYIPSFTNRTLTFIETNKHTFGSSHLLYYTIFRKYRIFWWFSKQYKTLDFKHYLWTHQHFICWRFSKYLYSQVTDKVKEELYSMTFCCCLINIEQFTFGNVIFWNYVLNVNATSCNIPMLGIVWCYVSCIFIVMVFNWVTIALGRFRRLVRGCDRLVSELYL